MVVVGVAGRRVANARDRDAPNGAMVERFLNASPSPNR